MQDLQTANSKANQILPQLLNLKENKQDRNTFDIKSELGIVK